MLKPRKSSQRRNGYDGEDDSSNFLVAMQLCVWLSLLAYFLLPVVFYIMPVYNAVLRRVLLLSLLLFAQALFVEILIQRQSVLVCSHGLFVFHFHRIDILVS